MKHPKRTSSISSDEFPEVIHSLAVSFRVDSFKDRKTCRGTRQTYGSNANIHVRTGLVSRACTSLPQISRARGNRQLLAFFVLSTSERYLICSCCSTSPLRIDTSPNLITTTDHSQPSLIFQNPTATTEITISRAPWVAVHAGFHRFPGGQKGQEAGVRRWEEENEEE